HLRRGRPGAAGRFPAGELVARAPGARHRSRDRAALRLGLGRRDCVARRAPAGEGRFEVTFHALEFGAELPGVVDAAGPRVELWILELGAECADACLERHDLGFLLLKITLRESLPAPGVLCRGL